MSIYNFLKKHKKIVIFSVSSFALLGLVSYTQTDKYFEIAKNLDIFANVYKEVNTYYVDEVNPTTFMKDGIDAMLEKLDPYTNYIAEDDIEDFRTMMTGQYAGIGAIIGIREEQPMILMPYEGFPAHKAGLKIGDIIMAVDGIDCLKKSTGDISKLLKGQAGTQAKVTIKRYGQDDPLDIIITREKIQIDNVPYYGMIDNETGYIKLSEFTNNASDNIKKALTELKAKGANKLVFDLRGNPGGLLNEAVQISNLFIPKDKPVVSTKGKSPEWNKVYSAAYAPYDLDIPIAVLTNGRSASASEIVSGVLQDYDRAVVVGQRSFGKGLVQSTHPLSYNSQLKITIAKYYTPSGRCIQAIDYSHKNKDGEAAKIPDSLRNEFKTANGRSVFDGGGISPDIEVKKASYHPIFKSLYSKNILFNYASKYAFEHPTIADAKSFQLTDKDFEDFINYIKDKDYDYTTEVEETIKELEEKSKEEKYFDAIKEDLIKLKEKVSHDKLSDVRKFKKEITEALEAEIASRYYLEKGEIEASFDDDEDIQAALQILNDPDKYREILTKK